MGTAKGTDKLSPKSNGEAGEKAGQGTGMSSKSCESQSRM